MSTPIAFLILAHDDPAHLHRLAMRLAPHPVYIHVDARAGGFGPGDLAAMPHVRMIAPRRKVYWADFSVIEATLALIDALAREGGADHAVLLSGHCYPIKPIAGLRAYLARIGDADAIKCTPVTPGAEFYHCLSRRWRHRPILPPALIRTPAGHALDSLIRRIVNKARQPIPSRLPARLGPEGAFHGSQWWALSRASLEAVRQFRRDHPLFDRWFAQAFAPDEFYFQTILKRTPRSGRQVGGSDDLGMLNLYDAPLHLVTSQDGRWVEDTAAMRAQLATSEKFFVRRIRSTDCDLLAWIDAELLGERLMQAPSADPGGIGR